ncbi:MAG: hypothetical protein H0W71_09305 [Sphingomonas sp.]|nr:hypothetical protein [Sphingomonas sp.]
MIEWLIGTLVATSGLMVLVLAIREPVRRHFGAAIAYALWLLPAARMAMPSLIRTVERAIPSTSATTVVLPAGSTAAPMLGGDPGLVGLFGGWPTILISVWLAGAAVFLIRGLALYMHQRRLILGDGVQLARIGRICLVRSERVRGPMALGILDPIVVVPFDFDQRFSECQRRLALDHELAHHRAGDLVANHIAFVLLCLQWFNPLAWAAHAAFRFDQEAACDARVLDKSDGPDRASYGEAIAKAASGRTLLFSGALDRPSTLSKRLTLMTYHIDPRRRKLGFAAIVAGVLVALPLTATWAINYVDVAAPPAPNSPLASIAAAAPASAAAPISPASPAAPNAPVAPVKLAALAPVSSGVSIGPGDISFIANDSVHISGVTKKWSDLTPSERARIRTETAKARRQLNEQIARLPQEMAQAKRETDKFRNGEFRREMESARQDMRNAIAEIDGEAADLRANGVDPEKLKVEIRRSMSSLENMNIDKVVRDALASVDPEKIRADVMSAAKSLDEIDIKLDQFDRR